MEGFHLLTEDLAPLHKFGICTPKPFANFKTAPSNTQCPDKKENC